MGFQGVRWLGGRETSCLEPLRNGFTDLGLIPGHGKYRKCTCLLQLSKSDTQNGDELGLLICPGRPTELHWILDYKHCYYCLLHR